MAFDRRLIRLGELELALDAAKVAAEVAERDWGRVLVSSAKPARTMLVKRELLRNARAALHAAEQALGDYRWHLQNEGVL